MGWSAEQEKGRDQEQKQVGGGWMQRDGSIGEPSQLFGTGKEGFTTRPVIAGRKGVVTAGHYLAAVAGMYVIRDGGNAIDAGVAMGFCEALLEPQNDGIAGESP